MQCVIWLINDIPQLFYRLPNVFKICSAAFSISVVHEDIYSTAGDR